MQKINFASVSNDNIKQWHPQFLVDTVPDVPAAQLPESPEMKVYTAKDVLNKFKGSIQAKVNESSKKSIHIYNCMPLQKILLIGLEHFQFVEPP